MALEGLVVFAAGYWLAESRSRSQARHLDLEGVSGVIQDALDLSWQTFLLVGLGFAQPLLGGYFPQIRFAGLSLTLIFAYGLSCLRRRVDGASAPYFLALTALALILQPHRSSGGLEWLKISVSMVGGSVACEAVLLGLKDRLRTTQDSREVPSIFLCLALLASVIWSLR